MSGDKARLPDMRSVAELLGDRLEALCRDILAAGHYAPGRRAWRCGSVLGEAGSALRVHLSGPRRGRWTDFKSGLGGDTLDLVTQVVCGGDRRAGWRWACYWLGVGAELNEADCTRLRGDADRRRRQRETEARREAERHAHDARAVWLAGHPLQPGDLAWRYLESRGSDLALLPAPPAALRLHPGLWNREGRLHWPVLVAAICGPDGRHVNTHCLWLAARPDGTVGKAPLAKPKLSLPGGYAGGCIRLWKGASGKPWKDMPDGETVLAGEGIEDTLAIVCARPEWRACAVLSVASLEPLVLPSQVKRLIWVKQNDPPRSVARLTLARALAAHRAAGRRVSVIQAPRIVKDVAELAEASDAPDLVADPDPMFGEAA
jgi:hypothetical protein